MEEARQQLSQVRFLYNITNVLHHTGLLFYFTDCSAPLGDEQHENKKVEKKKPFGGVSMFGGFSPLDAIKQRSSCARSTTADPLSDEPVVFYYTVPGTS